MNEEIDKLRNMIIITMPQAALMIFKTYKGIKAWMSDFSLKQLEGYYRLSFTYNLFVVIIRVLIVILIFFQFDVKLISLYAGECVFQFGILLPSMENYIQEKKDEEIRGARAQINVIKQQYSPLTPNTRRQVQHSSSSGSLNAAYNSRVNHGSEKAQSLDIGSGKDGLQALL